MKKTLLGLALAFAASTGAANAAPVYAQSIVSYDQNGTVVTADRSDPEAVKGAADGVFYSLGLGGNMVLDFGSGFVKAPGNVSEITFKLEGYIEKVRVYVSKTLDFTGAESVLVSNQQAGLPGGVSLTFAASSFRYVKLVDLSPKGYNRDGFDVDSISFSPVPVPAAGLMLAGAVAGLGALRRRAKKA
jgi:hypothetical protein